MSIHLLKCVLTLCIYIVMDINEMRRRYREKKAQEESRKSEVIFFEQRFQEAKEELNRFKCENLREVTLESVGQCRLQIIKILHQVLQITINEVKQIVDNTPYCIGTLHTYDAEDLQKKITNLGGQIIITMAHDNKNVMHYYGNNDDITLLYTNQSTSSDSSTTPIVQQDNKNKDIWIEETQKAINLLYQLEKYPYAERNNSLSVIEKIKPPMEYEAEWNQILRIWRTFARDLMINTKTLPNPDGIRYSQRPYPIKGGVGVQELIKEIVKNTK